MRIYNVPIDADLFDIVNSDEEDYISLVRLLHNYLVINYDLKVSGCMIPWVKGRAVAKFGDFIE